ncbi:MAG: protein kinase [Deltaproteobacteria bacterium]|nr:protein kinase [Deltaproteobacteria bacterium]
MKMHSRPGSAATLGAKGRDQVSNGEVTFTPGARMLGQHEVLVRLAAGGAANVFLVRDTKAPAPGRLVALKVLLPSLAANDDFLNMFFTEARIAQRLLHPNVVAITGFGQAEGIYCLAMEYVFGASLAQVLRASARARKPLTVGVLLRITAQVCDALHYAHELADEQGRPMGLVHRDVTPQNILIGFNGVPKLTDFGIAKATNRGWETQAGIVKGKFSYMSPEQAVGKKVDRRSDIFGTGIVLWEALTGKELFKGTSPMEVIEAIRTQPIVPPSKVVPGLSPIVDPIVMKALKRSPRQRYQTAQEMKQEIEDLIDRAGVKIDAETISKEFADIFGDVIVERAFALRSAMAGHADLDELARVLAAQRMREDHLPVIPGGASDPDPLGLFIDEDLDEASIEEEMGPEISLPARADEGFTNAFPALADTKTHEPVVDEPDEEDEDDGPDEELLGFEIDVNPPSDGAVVVDGWEDSTRMMQPSDELLEMLSEQDATIGALPPEFAARFGGTRLRVERADFDDLEGTIAADASEYPDDDRTVDGSALAERYQHSGGKVSEDFDNAPPTQAAGQAVVLRGVSAKRLEPADPLRASRLPAPSHRPVPRAPSLDLEGPTPLPDLELIADVVRPPAMPPPPPPRRISSTISSVESVDLPKTDDDLPPVAPSPLEEPESERAPSPVLKAATLRVPTDTPNKIPSGPSRPPTAPKLAAESIKPGPNSDPGFSGSQPPILSSDALRELVAHEAPRPAVTPVPLSMTPSEITRTRTNAIRLKPVGLFLLAVMFVVVGVALGILLVKLLPQIEALLNG